MKMNIRPPRTIGESLLAGIVERLAEQAAARIAIGSKRTRINVAIVGGRAAVHAHLVVLLVVQRLLGTRTHLANVRQRDLDVTLQH